MFRRFLADEVGATAIEYALITSLISIAVISAYQYVAEASNDNYFKLANAIQGATGG